MLLPNNNSKSNRDDFLRDIREESRQGVSLDGGDLDDFNLWKSDQNVQSMNMIERNKYQPEEDPFRVSMPFGNGSLLIKKRSKRVSEEMK